MRQRFLPVLTARTLYHAETMALSAFLAEIIMLLPKISFLNAPPYKLLGKPMGAPLRGGSDFSPALV